MIDRIASGKKSPPDPQRPRGRWWSSLRKIITILAPATLAWTLSCLAHSPSSLDLLDLEALRSVPNFHVEVEEAPGKDDGEMELTVDLSNIGPKDYPVFASIRPLQTWVSFGPKMSVRAEPRQQFDASVRADYAMVRLLQPMKSGTHASIKLSPITVDDRPSGQFSGRAISLYVYTGRQMARIMRHRQLPPKPTSAPFPSTATPKQSSRGRP